MVFGKSLVTAAAIVVFASVASVQAATVPFTEHFPTDNANWKDADLNDLLFVGSGGPGLSSYVTGSYDFVNAAVNDDIVLLRGRGSLGASGGAFTGNWIADGVTEVTAYVRHSAAAPMNFFLRAAGPANFPGAVAIDFVPVLPNVWTQVTFDVTPSSPQIVTFEGTSYGAVFSNIGNVQFGARVPAGVAGVPGAVTIDLDQPTITPEPASAGLFAAGALAMLRRRR